MIVKKPFYNRSATPEIRSLKFVGFINSLVVFLFPQELIADKCIIITATNTQSPDNFDIVRVDLLIGTDKRQVFHQTLRNQHLIKRIPVMV